MFKKKKSVEIVENIKDIPLPIYIDREVVFDSIAIIEDGISNIKEISSFQASNRNFHGEAGTKINTNNLFSLFGVSFDGRIDGNIGAQNNLREKYEKVHTPASLFFKLRDFLNNEKLLLTLSNDNDLKKLKSGSFIELKAKMKANPIVDTFKSFKQMFDLFMAFDEPNKKKQNKKVYLPKTENQIILKQMDALVSSLEANGSIDLIGDLNLFNQDTQNKLQVVISCKIENFINNNYNDILDGEYRILGKIVRLIPRESDETINLLRKTSMSKLNNALFSQMMSSLKDVQESGIEIDDFHKEIYGPVIQIIPICIYA